MTHPGAGPRDRRRPWREREFWVSLFARPALFAVWAFVLWGTLLILVLVASVFEVGARETLLRLVPGRQATVWDYLNAASVLLALLVWTLLATAWVTSGKSPGSGGGRG